MRHAVLLSCHEALIYLGDLSRYREEVLTKGEFNWSPAIGYYDLAGAIHPTSGASHHQLAVIARHGGGHLRVTYHFYRALATEEPYPNARANLELELKKVESAHSKGNLLNGESNGPRQKPEMVSIGLFMLLHSRLYRGVERSDDDALENEALAQLEIDLKQQSIGAVLNKLVVINVAAQYYAGVKFQSKSIISLDYLQAAANQLYRGTACGRRHACL